jgi:hypothetical protein
MTAKEYLWRVRDAERELKQLEQAYTQARADILHLKGIAYDADKVTGGKIGDLSDAIAALEGYAQRLNAKWDELINLRETAKKLIDTLKDGRYREVLTLRYLGGQSWEQVAVTMGYTYRGVTGLHGKALKVFGEINCS